MTTLLWLKGVVRQRSLRLLAATCGVALTVSLMVSLGAFMAESATTMTQRAIVDVPVEWQVLLAPGADQQKVLQSLGESGAAITVESVGYAETASFSASTDGTVQTTGPGKALGLPASYRQNFPGEIRLLIGSQDGVLVAQQTAANLHVGIGDIVTIQRPGIQPTDVVVAGVVELPYADSLFQAVDAPSGMAPQAPPDNVVILPIDQWHSLFDPQATVRPDSVKLQLHARLGVTLPPDPGAAYTVVEQLARNFEARIAGSGVVGNNLAARLDAVRADSLYARVLFLFLGTPGILLAILLTVAIAASGAAHRRQEQALLQLRGANRNAILRLASVEAWLMGLGGIVLGWFVAIIVTWQLWSPDLLVSGSALIWAICATLAGLVLAFAAVLIPAWQQAQQNSVMSARRSIGRAIAPYWQKIYLDLILLVVAAFSYWRSTRTGYQIVLAPEGVPAASVSYAAFVGPLSLWIGAALLAWRLWDLTLAKGLRLGAILAPAVGALSDVIAAAMARQHILITRGVILVALAFVFASSTAIFNTTYHAQALVDAALTNGADVAIFGATAAPPGSKLAELAALPGVVAAQPMQHRFAYVGNDLQDLYGVDSVHLNQATTIANAYFANGDAKSTMKALAEQADGVLVSQETVTDFQLQPGDLLNLRLQNAHDHQYHIVPFHFIGVVREFPTAPSDSFLVANANYVADQTGTAAAETVLLRTEGDAAKVAELARAFLSALPGIQVRDIGEARKVIASSLTAVDLSGLTRLELVYALVFVCGATGLVLALSLLERRRMLALLSAFGARGWQLASFVWGEGTLMLVGGALTGCIVGAVVAQMLVKILTDVFDPPPEMLVIPWGYLIILLLAAVLATAVSMTIVLLITSRLVVEQLREL